MLNEVNNFRLADVVNTLLDVDSEIIHNYNYQKINKVFDSKYHYTLSKEFIKKYLNKNGFIKNNI